MKTFLLKTLKFFSLLFLLPGLAGLLASAILSTYYLDNLPRLAVPQQLRMVPRSIQGTVVYQTVEEDRQLSQIENSSIGVFLVGLAVGVVYLETWSTYQARVAEQEDELAEESGA